MKFGLRSSVIALASCILFTGMPRAAHAAGLGKIVVFSALGQPLRAEIEVSATRDELSGMKAQLASPDTFKQAGLDYATTLLGIRFSMDKRANGQSVIRLSSDRPINDPFVDLLLELNWPAGRLIREYTFLLDPPELMAKGSAPVALAAVKPALASKPPEAVRASAPIDDELRRKAVAQARGQARVQEGAPEAVDTPADGRGVREVKRGDTLRKIAGESKPVGVSLEQMLVGLLHANQEAFDGGNMNRLKAGKILSVPDKSSVEAVSAADAKKIVVAQSADWNSYRSKLAGVAAQAPSKEEVAKQEAGGKITAKVEDVLAPETVSRDQLKVSKTDAAGTKPGGTAKRGEEELIAKEKALTEASERLAALEKNVADLQKLLELKNQSLAELQKQAAANVAPLVAMKPVEEAKPQIAVAPTAAATPAPALPEAKPEPAAPATEKPTEATPAEPAAKPEAPKSEPKPAPAPKPAVAPKSKTPPPPPPEAPGFLDELLDNPLTLAGGGGILALIAAYFVARRRRAAKGEEVPLELNSTVLPQSSSLAGNSVFRSTGGQNVDTSQTPVQTDFSQAGPGSIDTDEVDPVAEADVYMAYGRDAQAEEILLEAKQKDPKRYAIQLKLLEIYSNRKDLKQFETLATDLYSETSGVGADWEKAAAMGIKLDPGNPLFGASAHAVPAEFDADATVIVSPQSIKSTITLPGELSQLAATASVAEPSAGPAVPIKADLGDLDFDLGLDDEKPSMASDGVKGGAGGTLLDLSEPVIDAGPLDFDLAPSRPLADASSRSTAAADETVLGLDFNLLDDVPAVASLDAGSNKEAGGLDFDLGIEPDSAKVIQSAAAAPVASGDVPEAADVDAGGLDFDLSLTDSVFLGRPAPDVPSFDMSSIDLDLKEAELPKPKPAPASFPVLETSPSPDVPESSFDTLHIATAVNPDFETEQSETIVIPQFGLDPDLLPDQDFSTAQAETFVNPQFAVGKDTLVGDNFSTLQAETVVNPQVEAEPDLLPEFDISANEEVATKLDLANAYEEMGDFEGARELLQEVLKEGDAAQRESAQAILNKIGN